MRIIGIDPGTVVCGYGIIESGGNGQFLHIASGDVKLNSRAPLQERLQVLYNALGELIKEHTPSQLCLEKIFYHKSIRSAFALGSVRGISLLLAAQHGLILSEYNPTEVKMALTGYGRAEKRQVQDMVKVILNLKASPRKFSEDCTDALALCICHINSRGNGVLE